HDLPLKTGSRAPSDEDPSAAAAADTGNVADVPHERPPHHSLGRTRSLAVLTSALRRAWTSRRSERPRSPVRLLPTAAQFNIHTAGAPPAASRSPRGEPRASSILRTRIRARSNNGSNNRA